MVREYRKNGKPKSYSMHDMLRDLCIKICDEDKFMHVKNGFKVTFSNPRRVSFVKSNRMEDVNVSTESMSLTRSIISIGGSTKDELLSRVFSASRLLRVLDLMDMQFGDFPTEIFEFVNLRFLGVRCDSRMPRGISRLWNLQTLIGGCRFEVASELWQLSELRNLKVNGIELLKDEEMNYSVMKKLQMVSVRLTKERATWDGFFKSIPNIKKLTVDDDKLTTSTEIDLSHLHKLEVLRCYDIRTMSSPIGFGYHSKVLFPCNIRKLVLFFCEINPVLLRTLCTLHKLEVLTIWLCDFERDEETREEEWEVAEGDEFRSLRFLLLKSLNLVRWIADETNFPRLRHLHVFRCWDLEEIPSGIGEIPTLQLIQLEECRKPLVASADRIVEEQSEYGNDDLKLRIGR